MELLYKNRSFSSCIMAAYNLLMNNFKGLVRCMWLPALLFSLFCAALVTLNVPNDKILAYGLEHPAVFIGGNVVLMLAVIGTSLWMLARLMSFLNEKTRKWNFARVTIVFLNMLAVSLVFGAIVFVLMRLMFMSGDAESHFTTKMAVMVLVSFVMVMLTLPLVYVNMKYLNEDNVSYWKSFIANYKTGAKYIGMIFITLLLTAIISLLVTSVIQLPFYVLMMALGTSQFGVLYGDPAGLPASFPLLVFFTLLIVMLVSCILTVFEMLVMYFLYGSIEQKQRERQEVSKVFEATVATT